MPKLSYTTRDLFGNIHVVVFGVNIVARVFDCEFFVVATCVVTSPDNLNFITKRVQRAESLAVLDIVLKV